jgi:hypothetical protein
VLGEPYFVSLPPAFKISTVVNEKYYFRRVDIHQYKDWHAAHIEIINAINSYGVVALPKYTRNGSNVTEMGTCWEDAVFFIFKHFRINSTQEFLLFPEGLRSYYPLGD